MWCNLETIPKCEFRLLEIFPVLENFLLHGCTLLLEITRFGKFCVITSMRMRELKKFSSPGKFL